jgi:hypothetical protein
MTPLAEVPFINRTRAVKVTPVAGCPDNRIIGRVKEAEHVGSVLGAGACAAAELTVRVSSVNLTVAVIVKAVIAGLDVAGEVGRVTVIAVTGAGRNAVLISINISRGLPAVTVGVLAVTDL